MNKKSPCPICSSTSFKKVLSKDMLNHIYHLVECKKCKLVFFNPLPSQDQLNKYYNTEYEVPLYQQRKVIKKGEKVLSILKKRGLKQNSKIFELGSSHGFFLNQVKKEGFKPYGVELSAKAVENAKKSLGITIENSIFDDSKLRNKKNFFDVCCMFDVLEHVINPNPILEGFHEILKKDGRVVFTVPNINSTEFKLFGKYWEWLSPPAHLYYYSPKTLRALLEKHKFEIEYIETYKGDSAGNILFHLYLSLRQSIFYLLKYVYGRKRLLQKKKQIGKKIDINSISNKKEFSGISGVIYDITELFNPFLKNFNKKRYKKGKGPTLLVVARKK